MLCEITSWSNQRLSQVVCHLESIGDCDLLSSRALPRGVRVTLDSFVLTPLSSGMRPSINAFSQTECLGHVVRQASIASV